MAKEKANKLESEADRITREMKKAEDFKKKYSGVIKTVDSILGDFSKGDKGLVDSLLEDFAPSDSKKKPGISAGSIFKLIGYAFRNPGKIGDLLTLARNPQILQNKTFQQEILKEDSTWNFVDTLGERLPKIGQALAGFGVKEFQKGNILDQEGLKKLQPLITEKRSRFALKEIANNFLDPKANQNKNIDKIVNLMLTNNAFKDYMSTKKESLKNYAVATARYLMQPEVKYYEELQRKGIPLDEQAIKIGKRLSNDLKDQMASFGIKLKDVEKLAELIPILMDKPGDLQKFYASYSNTKATPEMEREFYKNHTKATKEEVEKFYGSFNKAKTTPEEEREFYKKHTNATKEQIEEFNKSLKPDWAKLGSDVIAMAKDDKNVQNFLINNSEIFQNIMVATAKTTAQKYLDEYKVNDEHLKVFSKLVPILVNNPNDLLNLYEKGYAKPNYTELGRDVLALADKNDDVKQFLRENAKTFQEIMVNNALAIATSEAKPENYGLNQESMKSVANLGLSKESLEKITDLVPLLLDKPKQLKEFYDILVPPIEKDGKQPQMDLNNLVNKVFELSEDPKIKGYLKEKGTVFQEIMVSGAFATPGVKEQLEKYGVNKEQLSKITDLVPILLDKPEQLKKFYEICSPLLNKDNKPGPELEKLTSKVFNDLIQEVFDLSTDPKVKNYLKENAKVFQEVMVSGAFATPGVKEQLEKYGITKQKLEKITDIVPILLDDPAALKKFYNNVMEGKFTDLGKDLLELSKTNPKLDKYLKNNQDLFKGVVDEVIKTTPVLQQYGVKSELLDLFSPLLSGKHADKVQGLINLYEEVGKADPKEQTGKYIDLAIALCKLLEDKEISEQLNNNRGNLGKIVQNVVDNVPVLKGYLGEMKVDELASNIIKDPKGLREGIEAYQKGGKALAWGAGKLIVNKMMDPEFRGAVIKGVGTWLLGDGNIKQQVVDHALSPLGTPLSSSGLTGRSTANDKDKMDSPVKQGNDKDMVKTRPNLKELAQNAIENLDKPNPKKLKEVKKLAKNDLLFTKVNIKDKMEDMDISSVNFSNSVFLLNASFVGSVLKNTNFTGAKFTRINFEGAEIDGKTLATLTEQLKNKSVSLKGVKITGDIPPGTNLTNVDLSGADLSEVTSMKGVNLKGADLPKDKLPKDKSVLEGAKNLVLYNEKELAQIDILTNKITENLFGKDHGRKEDSELIKTSLKEVFSKQKTKDKDFDLAGHLEKNMDQLAGQSKENGLSKLYYKNSSYTTVGLTTGGIYLDKKKILAKKFSSELDNNVKNSRKPLEKMGKSHDHLKSEKPIEKMSKSNDSLAQTSFSNEELIKIKRLSDKIGENLFGKNHTRKEDGELIKESLQEAFKDLKKQNNNVDITGIIGQSMDKLVGEVKSGYLSTSRTGLTELYYKNSSYTTAGLTTGGIYLDKNKMQSKEFASSLTTHLDKEVGGQIKSKGLSKQVPNVKSHVVENKQYSPTPPNVKEKGSGKEIG